VGTQTIVHHDGFASHVDLENANTIITLGRPPLDLRGSWIMVPLAHTLVAVPLVLRTVLPVLRSIDPRLREAATTLGAFDTVKFVALDIKQPAKLSHPLPNSFCLQCHESDVSRTGFDNHFHNKLTDPKAPVLNCTSCHVAHAEADVLNKFILREAAYPNCNACHQQLGGPTNLK